MFPEWSWIIGLLLGATIGSFLNVVIYRLPRGISLSNPPNSFCPKCKHQLGPLDLFPLFSWLISGGKCRYCKEPVAPRYFLVELLNGAIWAGIWWQYVLVRQDFVTAAFYALVAAALVAIIFIDWELYIIPDELNATILLIAVAYHGFTGHWNEALYGGLAGWGAMWGMQLLGGLLFRKHALGDGDIKMMRGVGVVLGPLLLGAGVGIAVLLGIVGGVAGMILAGKQPAPVSAEGEESDQAPDPVYVTDILVLGIYYLLCLDVLALVFHGVENATIKLLRFKPPEEEEDLEDDSWKTPTTIPFGPYLAAGSIVCMLFAAGVEKGLKDYWQNATGASTPKVSTEGVYRHNNGARNVIFEASSGRNQTASLATCRRRVS